MNKSLCYEQYISCACSGCRLMWLVIQYLYIHYTNITLRKPQSELKPCSVILVALSHTTDTLKKDKQVSLLKLKLTGITPTQQCAGGGIAAECHTLCQTLRDNDLPNRFALYLSPSLSFAFFHSILASSHLITMLHILQNAGLTCTKHSATQ